MHLVRGSQMVGVRQGFDLLQQFCLSEADAWRRIREFWDKAPLYVSCPFRYSSTKYACEYYVDRIWYDSDGKIENCLSDLRRLEKFASECEGDAVGFLSKTGIHPHFFLEPEWMTRERIEKLILAKRKIVTFCNLRSIDWSGVGDMAKLPRLPNSLTSGGTYCV